MAHRIKVFNSISPEGLKVFGADFAVSADEKDPEGILVRSATVDTDQFPSLLAVARAGAGVNNITVGKATDKGIVVFNTPGANANAVAELVFVMLGLFARNILKGISFCRDLRPLDDKEFEEKLEKGKSACRGFELARKVLGVLGLGKIGTLVANGGVERGMRVIGFDPHPVLKNIHQLSPHTVFADTSNEVVSKADILTLHMPLSDATRGMVNREFLKPFKKGGVLVNFSRGAVCNEDDILAALAEGKLSAYITDFPTPRLMANEHVLCTPHLGASTEESEENCAVMACNELRAYFKLGHVAHSVNFPTVESPPDRSFTNRLIVINRDVPKMIGWISQTLGEHGLNIESYRNESNGKIGYNIIDLRSAVPAPLVERIGGNPNVIRARVIKLG
ncbi:MAG TPA: 3-phosphoglycerate dehydrogenase family protein [Planctomycetota bacterium]|jgi:D-3-phosphoglycerate dehydrogenase|nr:3-phosphoglycerate dehydrogenase [Planctomycetota bacterium]OQC20018.1 MAG: D-3-phosphoglycerate dehydrogenase [Planctomycetes bacterium ADurb.Bin069]HNR99568.1 3-phosphoglycerate dehydrogenase family protein [Planctomycetota bacterium]HNU26496.1 3-phosphoglycerate dehydrogenase family protein [Planctomycetota bacterium]HOE28408.1 3-phosphoglycerate dehydrogenase family protein [Planctomycetota bacterium]